MCPANKKPARRADPRRTHSSWPRDLNPEGGAGKASDGPRVVVLTRSASASNGFPFASPKDRSPHGGAIDRIQTIDPSPYRFYAIVICFSFEVYESAVHSILSPGRGYTAAWPVPPTISIRAVVASACLFSRPDTAASVREEALAH